MVQDNILRILQSAHLAQLDPSVMGLGYLLSQGLVNLVSKVYCFFTVRFYHTIFV